MWKFEDTQALCRKRGFKNYTVYINSDHWHNLKKEAGINSQSICCVCHRTGTTLGHHIRYRNLLDVLPGDIAPMCFECHDDFHAVTRETIGYVDREIPEIIEITKAFQISPEGKVHKQRRDDKFIVLKPIKPQKLTKKQLRKQQRQQKRKHQNARQSPHQADESIKSLKSKIRKRFERMISYCTPETSAEFCNWMMDEMQIYFGKVCQKAVINKAPDMPKSYIVFSEAGPAEPVAPWIQCITSETTKSEQEAKQCG